LSREAQIFRVQKPLLLNWMETELKLTINSNTEGEERKGRMNGWMDG
jgi:hypothetical protein